MKASNGTDSLVQDSEFLEKETNNEAEICGLILGLHRAVAAGITALSMRGNLQLIIAHITGRARCTTRSLSPLLDRALRRMDPRSFPNGIDVQWVGRNCNAEADAAAWTRAHSLMGSMCNGYGATVMWRRIRRLTRGCVHATKSAGSSSSITSIVPPATDAARLHLPARPYICTYPYFAIAVGSRSLRVRPRPFFLACILRASARGRIALLAQPPLGESSCA